MGGWQGASSAATQANIVAGVVPIATATDITTRYAKTPQNYLFRISMVDREQIALLVAYAVKTPGSSLVSLAAHAARSVRPPEP